LSLIGLRSYWPRARRPTRAQLIWLAAIGADWCGGERAPADAAGRARGHPGPHFSERHGLFVIIVG
jgi:low temperature requirement protein LtrA